MKSRLIILLLGFLLAAVSLSAQEASGYVINVENGEVNLDLTKAQVQVGSQVKVVQSGGYFTHPVTKKKLKKEDRVVCTLQITGAYAEYSVASPVGGADISKVQAGMTVQVVPQLYKKPEEVVNTPTTKPTTGTNGVDPLSSYVKPVAAQPGKHNIVIAPAEVNDVVNNGHFGGYVADILMEQMMMCDKVRLLDRSVLNAQMNEIDLAGSLLDPATTIQRGKAVGARYILQTTMQKPDVANIRTGIPLAAVMGAVQAATGTNIGAAYASNATVATLKASVSISVRVVDLQTGEVVFMTSAKGDARGKSQLSLEYGALGGGQLNGGAQDFKQTVTGKAIQRAFVKIGRNLQDFFNGTTNKKVVGSISGGVSPDERLYAKGYKIYSGTQKLDKDDIASVFSGREDLFFAYKKAKRKKYAWTYLLPLNLGAGILFLQAGSDDGVAAYSALGAGFCTVGIVSSIWTYQVGKKRMKKIVNSYNTSRRYSYYEYPTSSMELSVIPMGVRLTF